MYLLMSASKVMPKTNCCPTSAGPMPQPTNSAGCQAETSIGTEAGRQRCRKSVIAQELLEPSPTQDR